MNLLHRPGRPFVDSAPELSAAPPDVQRILVIGGSSGIGLETCKLALSRGHRVTLMSRHPERAHLDDSALSLQAGDVRDAAEVRRAMRNQDAVVLSLGTGLTRKPVSMFSTGTRNVLDSLDAANDPRLVAVTGMGAGETRTHGGFFYDRIFRPLALQTVYDDKDRQESLIHQRAADLPLRWTIARPGMLGNGIARHSYRVVTDLTGIDGGNISRADVAHFILAAIEQDRYVYEAPMLIN